MVPWGVNRQFGWQQGVCAMHWAPFARVQVEALQQGLQHSCAYHSQNKFEILNGYA